MNKLPRKVTSAGQFARFYRGKVHKNLEHSRIVSPDGSSRPAIVGKRQITPATHTLHFSWLSPMVAFGNNLFIYDWINKVMRLLKCFVVKRNVGHIQTLAAAIQLSRYN